MFHVRTFLRNHGTRCRWKRFPSDLKPLLRGSSGSLLWAEFYGAAPKHGRYSFTFLQRTPCGLQEHQADWVMLQESSSLLTLIRHPQKRGGPPEIVALDATTIESAEFRARTLSRRKSHASSLTHKK